MKKTPTPRSGFTLIELLTVIAIIGILAGILIPTVGLVQVTAKKMSSSSSMKEISRAYATYVNSGGGRVRSVKRSRLADYSSGETVAGVAEFLADKAELNTSSVWIISSDPAVEEYDGDIPETVGYFDSNNNYQKSEGWRSSIPVGYDFAVGISSTRPPSTTPLLWTRGLETKGKWDAGSPWGRGGHIAYLDGHVLWYDELGDDDGNLIDPNTGRETTNINDVHDANDILRAPKYSR